MFFPGLFCFLLLLPEVLHGNEKHHMGKGDQLAEEEEVGGKPSILLMKIVVITSMVVRFTLKAASKKNGLKKVVA